MKKLITTMVKKNIYEYESQFLCDICNIAVTNPICPNCLSQEIDAWTTYYPDIRRTLLPKLKKYLTQADLKIIFEATQCIKCNEKTGIICPYCFTEFVYEELKMMKVSKIVLNEFIEFFNFDLAHNGYYIEYENQ